MFGKRKPNRHSMKYVAPQRQANRLNGGPYVPPYVALICAVYNMSPQECRRFFWLIRDMPVEAADLSTNVSLYRNAIDWILEAR